MQWCIERNNSHTHHREAIRGILRAESEMYVRCIRLQLLLPPSMTILDNVLVGHSSFYTRK